MVVESTLALKVMPACGVERKSNSLHLLMKAAIDHSLDWFIYDNACFLAERLYYEGGLT